MRNIFLPGDQKHFSKVVTDLETAKFDSGEVHPVYATFALAKDAEWVCRLFVIDMKEEDEEGIGTALQIDHQSPAKIGETVEFTAVLDEVKGSSVKCSFVAKVGERIIATGSTGQKILKISRIEQIFASL